MRTALFLAGVLLATTAHAQTVVTVDGVPRAILSIDASGNVQLSPVQQVVELSESTPPTPPPPPPPNPDGLAEVSEASARRLDDPQTARDLAIAYSVVILRAESGAFDDTAQIGKAMRAAADALLKKRGVADKWQAWRDDVTDELTAMAQEGGLRTVSDYVAALKDMRTGLIAAAGAGRAEQLDLGGILEIVQLVIQVLEGDELDLESILRIVVLVLDMFRGASLAQPAVHESAHVISGLEMAA